MIEIEIERETAREEEIEDFLENQDLNQVIFATIVGDLVTGK
jgi:hypothetical protein